MLLTAIVLGLSLAADAFVVSLALGLTYRTKLSFAWLFAIPLCFGTFQFIMPLLGWKISTLLLGYIASFSNWIAIILLIGVGVNMIRQSRASANTETIPTLTLQTLLVLGLATSIDALAIGFTLLSITTQPLATITIVGVVTFSVCVLALLTTSKIPTSVAKHSGIIAGCVLITLSCKIIIYQLLQLL